MALFISADHVDQKSICIVSYPVITILTQLLTSRQALLPWGGSVSLESVVVA